MGVIRRNLNEELAGINVGNDNIAIGIKNCYPSALGGIIGSLSSEQEDYIFKNKLHKNEEYLKILEEINDVKIKIEIKRSKELLKLLKKNLGE